MKNFKNEITIVIVGGILLLFGFINFSGNASSSDSSSHGADLDNDVIQLNAKVSNKPGRSIASSSNSSVSGGASGKSTVNALGKSPINLDLINQKLQCLENYDCNYANNDPREYSLEVYQDVARTIGASIDSWSKNWNKFDFSQQEEVMSFFKSDSGYVKEEMLNFLNSLSIEDSRVYYDVVVSDVLKYHDANLINESMKYLEAIKDASNEVEISKDLVGVIANGSPHVAETVSKYASSFISDTTKGIFADLAASLPVNSPEVLQVNAALNEYEMVASGG